MQIEPHNKKLISLIGLSFYVPFIIVSPDCRNSISLLMVAGVSMLLLLPRLSRHERPTEMFIASYAGLLLGSSVLVFHGFFGSHQQLHSMLACAAVAGPVAFRASVASLRMAKDVDYLCEDSAGWENTLYYGNMMVTIVFVSLYLTMQCVCSSGQGTMNLAGFACLALMIMVCAFLIIRNVTGYDSGSSKEAKGRLRTQMRNIVGTRKGREVGINYKMLYGRIKEYMEEQQPYLDPSFGLEDMAKAMYTNSGYISRMINACTGSNLSQFVNGYRVRHAMDLYRKDTGLKMSELAQLSGFNNKVTFNMAFKLVTDETPGQWCRHYLESMHQAKDLSSRKEQHR